MENKPLDQAVSENAERMLGKTLITALVDEIRALPDTWQKMSADSQDQVLMRLTANIEHQVGRAIRILATRDAPTVNAVLESVTIKDGAKLTLKVGAIGEAMHQLIDAQGAQVMVTLVDPETYTKSAHDVAPDADEPELPLGGQGDGEGMPSSEEPGTFSGTDQEERREDDPPADPLPGSGPL